MAEPPEAAVERPPVRRELLFERLPMRPLADEVATVLRGRRGVPRGLSRSWGGGLGRAVKRNY
jgi:hypothetical protein